MSEARIKEAGEKQQLMQRSCAQTASVGRFVNLHDDLQEEVKDAANCASKN